MSQLLDAARAGDLGIVTARLAAGDDIDERDEPFERTPLHLATIEGHVDVVSALLENGADVHATNIVKCTALHLAARIGHLEVVTVLIEKGSDIHAKDSSGCTALHEAARKGHLDIMMALIENGADVFTKDKDSGTLLHYAAHGNQLEVAVALIEMGIDAHVKDKHNRRAVDLVGDWCPNSGDVRAAMQQAATRMTEFWTVRRHRHFGVAAHRCVMTVLLCNGRADGGALEVPWLPAEVWLLILERLRRREMELPLQA